jgi:hypothetical protein
MVVGPGGEASTLGAFGANEDGRLVVRAVGGEAGRGPLTGWSGPLDPSKTQQASLLLWPAIADGPEIRPVRLR